VNKTGKTVKSAFEAEKLLIEVFEMTKCKQRHRNQDVHLSLSINSFVNCDIRPETKYSDVHWSLLEPAILTVKKAGGLKMGEYEVEVSYTNSSSYIPPQLDTVLVGPTKRKMVLVR